MSENQHPRSTETDRVQLTPRERGMVLSGRLDGAPVGVEAVVEHLLTEQRRMDYDMHLAYRPEVVAEIAVRLDEEHDWEATAKWCGGTLRNAEVGDSGEYESHIDIPGVGAAWQGSWITLDHAGTFRIRAEVDGPERSTRPADERPSRTEWRVLCEHGSSGLATTEEVARTVLASTPCPAGARLQRRRVLTEISEEWTDA